ncbi:hypothetical protein [Micromonospora sp. NPDC049891]|uniref:hypothetical protein n=1 Tax=Micromonospora sp. NPDC049891 TaxID=3155655 RepID=UPI0033EFB17F
MMPPVGGFPALRTLDEIRANPRHLPSWSDDDAWTAELVAVEIARVPVPPHTEIHTRPQPGCDRCPPTACPCGRFDCPDVFDHRREWAGSETTWREVAA